VISKYRYTVEIEDLHRKWIEHISTSDSLDKCKVNFYKEINNAVSNYKHNTKIYIYDNSKHTVIFLHTHYEHDHKQLCPHCNSDKFNKKGKYPSGGQRYKCKKCLKVFK